MKKLIRTIIAAALLALYLSTEVGAQIPSPSGTRVPPAPALNVPAGVNVWTLGKPDPSSPGNSEIVRNGVVTPYRSSSLLYCDAILYVLGRSGKVWYKATESSDAPGAGVLWSSVANVPCSSSPPVVPPVVVPPVVVPPVVIPPASACPITNSGGLFTVGNSVEIKNHTGGWNVRAQPDMNTVALVPAQTEGMKGTVTCVRQVGADQWVEIDFATGTDGWARQGCCDKAGVPVVPPPPPPPPPGPIDPIPGASFYLSSVGDDSNPGTNDLPFKTFGKAIPLLQPGQTLVIRGGVYDTGGFTKAGGDTIFTTGLSWEQPIRVHAAPGEKVEFVRDLAPGTPFTLEQVRAGVHAPTEAQAKYYASQYPGYFLPWPEATWAGGPGGMSLWLFQDDTGATTGPIVDFVNAQHQVQFLEFKGIDFNGRGITKNIFSTSSMNNCDSTVKNIRILNSDIGYSAASAFSQPGTCDNDSKGVRNASNITIMDSKIHHCGIPFDPMRKHPAAKYLHCLYGHVGGWECIRCEIYEAAGGGWEPDGHDNKLIDSIVRNHSCLGAQMGGGNRHIVRGNIFYENGCAHAQLLTGQDHIFEHNTLVCGPNNKELGLQVTFGSSLIANNIISGCKTSIYSIQPVGYSAANRYVNNLIDGAHVNSGAVAPVVSGMITADPMLDANYVPRPGSPAIKAATDGKNIGARQ